MFFEEVRKGFHKKQNIQLSLKLFPNNTKHQEIVHKCNSRIISYISNEISVLSELKEDYFKQTEICPKLEWLGDKKIFLVVFVIFYNKKWLGVKGQKMSRIEVFKQLSLFFGMSNTHINNSISRLKLKERKRHNTIYPFKENIFRKYFLEHLE